MGKRRPWQGPKPKKRQPAPSKCRDCGHEAVIPRYEYYKAARPRCVACGGTMEYLGGWQGTKGVR